MYMYVYIYIHTQCVCSALEAGWEWSERLMGAYPPTNYPPVKCFDGLDKVAYILVKTAQDKGASRHRGF